jgi:hypothetical protein
MQYRHFPNSKHFTTFYVSFMQYKAEESVKLWVNKVGPYNNPQETYNYYSLPFCQPSENPAHKWGGLGEVLGGNELIDSQLDIKFLSMLVFPISSFFFSLFICAFFAHCIDLTFDLGNEEKGLICTLELDSNKFEQFADAIENSYWFEFFIGMWLNTLILCVMMNRNLFLVSNIVLHPFRYQLFLLYFRR